MNEKIEDVKSLADVRRINERWIETFGRWTAVRMLMEAAYSGDGIIAEARKKFDANAAMLGKSVSFDEMLASVLSELEARHDESTEAKMKAREWMDNVRRDSEYGRYDIDQSDGYLVRNDSNEKWKLYQHNEPRYIQECVDEYKQAIQFRGNECLAGTTKSMTDALNELNSISDAEWKPAPEKVA